MSVKNYLAEQSMKMMKDDRFARVMQHKQVVSIVMRGIQLQGEVRQKIDTRLDGVAKALNFATKKEIRELKRCIEKLEKQLDHASE
ncbi:MAG: hypothetical protein AAF355_05710 [Myxococcota bacterium]